MTAVKIRSKNVKLKRTKINCINIKMFFNAIIQLEKLPCSPELHLFEYYNA